MVLGIDASNIRAGGGVTHLSQMLNTDAPREFGFARVVVWSGERTLVKLPEKPWLEKVHDRILDGPLPLRMAWQNRELPRQLKKAGCHALLAPGGILPSKPGVPTIVISQNLLPFELPEMRRFPPLSFMRLKMKVIRWAQIRSMQQATGLIFLTHYARSTVLPQLARHTKKIAVIPHGIEERYHSKPRPGHPMSSYSPSNPFRFLYVSIVDVYKHQWHVAEATASLRAKGYPIALDLVGPGYPPALRRLRKVIRKLDPDETFLHYRGPVSFAGMHQIYHRADGLVFASTCENLPNILLEGMAAGLPIACSDRGPMPEVLGRAGVYFSPEDPADIERALQVLLDNPEIRAQTAIEAFRRSKGYSWQHCARNTFSFAAEICKMGTGWVD